MKEQTDLDIYFYKTGFIFIGIGILLFLLQIITGKSLTELFPPCIFHAITGFYCPGCGGTRAFSYLLQGQLPKAFFYHPFTPYTVLLGGWFMISQSIERLWNKQNHTKKLQIALHVRSLYLWIALLLLFGNFLIKNIYLLVTHTALIA